MKCQGLTLALLPILLDSRVDEGAGMSGVAVKCVDIAQNTDCEGRSLGHI